MSNRLGNQIVIGVADDLDFDELTDGQSTFRGAHINPAVDVRRIRLAAADEVVPFHLAGLPVRFADETVFPGTDAGILQLFCFRLAFNEHLDFAAQEIFRDGYGHLVLFGHGAFAAHLHHLGGKLAGHGAGARAVFL